MGVTGVAKPRIEDILKVLKSGIGLDVAKNHTGVVIWDGAKLERFGFSINLDYAKSDPFAEYKMRREFKQKLSEIVNGKVFEHCIIEDVYGGENFDTTRKLLALNTVIDELIFDHVCFVDNFYRWNEPKWSKYLRQIYKQRGRLKSKLETQGVLDYLEDSFYLEHKDDTSSVKKEIFFEDICDATGMLLSVASSKILEINVVETTSIKMSDIKMVYTDCLEEVYWSKDERISSEGYIVVDLDTRNLKKSILEHIRQHPCDVLCSYLPSSKIGLFGVENKLPFYDNEDCYLLFYKKR